MLNWIRCWPRAATTNEVVVHFVRFFFLDCFVGEGPLNSNQSCVLFSVSAFTRTAVFSHGRPDSRGEEGNMSGSSPGKNVG